MPKIRVFVCDDHELMRKGIVTLLQTSDKIEVVGEAGNGRDAVDKVANLKVDVVLMDINMPIMDGIQATYYIKKENPKIKVIVLTISEEEDNLFIAIKNGADGYLLKNMNLDDLFHYIEQAYEGNPPFSPGLATKVLAEFSKLSKQVEELKSDDSLLSQREKEVLELVAKGAKNKEIADQLFISEHTVKKHLQHIMEKLHVQNRAEAAAYAIKKGLIKED
ncbi:response regulator transcription factor [Microaerobacter geothermalis]|uniref:response regulator n=1 Tax=Microaerobacter geothermalis TaxID=674972 RepID=UPI001F4226B0|nr:response regulator transcription factor [Microaerobacter geothermalis]MCF6092521.1 response regulator transcription factor [Microaerobacter geothermalis]